MGKFALGFGVGFVTGVVALPVAAVIVLDNSKSIEERLKKVADGFEKFNQAGEDDAPETAPADETPFRTPEGVHET